MLTAIYYCKVIGNGCFRDLLSNALVSHVPLDTGWSRTPRWLQAFDILEDVE